MWFAAPSGAAKGPSLVKAMLEARTRIPVFVSTPLRSRADEIPGRTTTSWGPMEAWRRFGGERMNFARHAQVFGQLVTVEPGVRGGRGEALVKRRGALMGKIDWAGAPPKVVGPSGGAAQHLFLPLPQAARRSRSID